MKIRSHNYNFKHGLSNTPLFQIWNGIRGRCYNPKRVYFPLYGGRGIKMSERWKDYLLFKKDMEKGFRKGMSIERKNVNGNYTKSNCLWIPRSEQAKNRRNTLWYVFKGQRKRLVEWANDLGVSYEVVRRRIRNEGWSVYKALNTPKRKIKLYVYNGKMFSLLALEKKLGMTVGTLYHRVIKRRMSLKDAILDAKKRLCQLYIHNGKMLSIHALEKELNMKRGILYYRIIKRHMSFKDALLDVKKRLCQKY